MRENYRFGGYFLETDSRSLLHADKIVRLSPKAFQILLMLITRQGQVVSKDDLLHAVWSDSFVEENNLAVHISALRRVLGENLSDTKHIETISGIGYRFLTKVETVRANDALHTYTAASETDKTPQNSRMNSIAVLPFTNKSGDSRLDYLAEGIAESLILNLSQLSKLKVISYSAVAGYKNKQVDIRETGFLLGVEAVVIGSVSEINEMLEISVELVQVSNLAHLWGMQYHRSFEELLKTRTEISLAIAESLHLRLSKNEERQLSKNLTNNSEAYRLYLKGLHFFEKRDKENLFKSLEYFERAVKISPEFALAYAALAHAHLNLAHFFILPTLETVAKVKEAIEYSISIDPYLSEAHSVNGILQLFSLELKNARQSFEKAIEFNSNNALAYSNYGSYLTIIGDFSKSLEYQHRAIELTPFIPTRLLNLTNRFYFMRQYQRAIDHTKELSEIFPSYKPPIFSEAFSYVELGHLELALKKADFIHNIYSTSEALLLKAYIYAHMDRKKEALKIVEGLQKNLTKKPADFYDIGIVYGVMGDKDKAFQYFNKAVNSKFTHLFIIKVDPRVDCLRDDPRFDAILEKLGLI